EWRARSMARSPIDTTLMRLPPSTTSRRRTALSRIRRTACSTSSVSDTEVSSWLQISPTLVAARSRPFRHTPDHDITVGEDAADPTVFEDDDVADIGVT